jgi:hypothetical protein
MQLNKISKILFEVMITVVLLTLAFIGYYLLSGGLNCLTDPIGYYKNITNITNFNCSCFMPIN